MVKEKRRYEKPCIIYDGFEMSQSIAGNCEGIANFAENLCSVTVNIGFDIQIYNNSNCEYTGPDFEDMVCYHVPSDFNNVFTS